MGKRIRAQLICGAFVQSRGELLVHTVGIDLFWDGLGDGDHSSELSLPLEGILFETADRVSVASCTWSPAQYFDVIARDYKITSNLYIISRDYVLLIE